MMEIPWWLDPGQIGEKTADWWLDRPSAQDPEQSNLTVLIRGVLTDVQQGRHLKKRYTHPLKEATRQGIMNAAIKKGYAPEAAENLIQRLDLESIALGQQTNTDEM